MNIPMIDASTRKVLPLIAAFGLAMAPLGCSGDDAEPMTVQDAGGNASNTDAAIEDPWDNSVWPGCTATDEPFEELPEDAGWLPSPAERAEVMAGTWTNEDGDMMTIQFESAGRIHWVEGMAANVGGTPATSCQAMSYVALTGNVALVTADGRFDENFDGELRMSGPVTLKANVALDAITGTFEAPAPNDGILRWAVVYDDGNGMPGWYIDGTVEPIGRVVELARFRSREQ